VPALTLRCAKLASFRSMASAGSLRFHVPVLVDEVVAAVAQAPPGAVVDATVGGGGHASALLEADASRTLLGLDRDPEALAEAARHLSRFAARVRLEHADFRQVGQFVAPGSVAAVVFDFGVSSHQLDRIHRGFTVRPGAPLDMRMDPSSGGPTAADLLADLSAEELARLFRRYGEEPRARALAWAIVRRRRRRPLQTSDDLLAVWQSVARRPPRLREAARLFQALRIAVNDELAAIDAALPQAKQALQPGGVIVAIAYHSLEDRLVKRAFAAWSRGCRCPPRAPVCACGSRAEGEVVTRRPRRPSAAEVALNPRARSARLRVWRKGA